MKNHNKKEVVVMKRSVFGFGCVALLLIICSRVKAGSSLIKRDSFLVDCSHSTGTIVHVRFDSEHIRSSVAVEDAAFFECVPEGYCIYRNKAGEWYAGNVKQPEAIVKIGSSVVPENVTYAAISHDGKEVIWVTHDDNRNSLILTEIQSRNSNSLVSKQGFICVPSWSPDNTSIAYYYGPPDAVSHDGYSLMIIEAKEIGPKERQVAPPSLWTKLSPSRTKPPQWSPDGTMILFEGRYDDQQPWTLRCVVGIYGENLRKVAGCTWSQDSECLFAVHATDDSEGGHRIGLSIVHKASEEKEVQDLGVALPKACLNYEWADDGKNIVFATLDNNCYLMEAGTGKQRHLFQCEAPCKFYWLSLTSVSADNIQTWLLFLLVCLAALVVGLLIIRFVKWGKGLPAREAGKQSGHGQSPLT